MKSTIPLQLKQSSDSIWGILFPHMIEELRIVFGYLWPTLYYQINKEDIAHTPSRVSLATGVTASENSTFGATDSLTPSPTPPRQEQSVPNHVVSGSRIPSPILPEQSGPSTSSRVPRPIRADLTVDQLQAQIRSGEDLDKVTFTKGNITYWHLQAIDRLENPPFLYRIIECSRQRLWATMEWRNRAPGRGRGGRGGAPPPTNTRPIGNPLEDPRIRYQLRQAILQAHKLKTGETPWNNNWENIPRENDTRIWVTLEFPPWAPEAPQNVPGATPAQNHDQRVNLVICLGWNKDLWSQRSKY